MQETMDYTRPERDAEIFMIKQAIFSSTRTERIDAFCRVRPHSVTFAARRRRLGRWFGKGITMTRRPRALRRRFVFRLFEHAHASGFRFRRFLGAGSFAYQLR